MEANAVLCSICECLVQPMRAFHLVNKPPNQLIIVCDSRDCVRKWAQALLEVSE